MKYQVNVYYISEYSYTIEAETEEDVEEIASEMTEDSDGTLVNSDMERVEISKLENEKECDYILEKGNHEYIIKDYNSGDIIKHI